MQIQPTSNISFQYSHPLKTLFKKGKIPLKYDFYGEPLTNKNVTIEHIQCVCNGGKTKLDNIVLSSANANQIRGSRPLSEVIDYKAIGEYFEVFKDKVFGCINGNEYIKACMRTIQEVLSKGG